MKIIIAKGDKQTAPLLLTSNTHINDCVIINIADARGFKDYEDADAFIDLGFNGMFYSNANKPLLINETNKTISELIRPPDKIARFCGWPGFFERPLWELACNAIDNNWLNPIMNTIEKQYEIVADKPGLVAPRILSMIINEAYHALSEGISTPHEIDMAMQLGTNYPEGPLSWGNRIGNEKIYELLNELTKISNGYIPHPLLKTNKI